MFGAADDLQGSPSLSVWLQFSKLYKLLETDN